MHSQVPLLVRRQEEKFTRAGFFEEETEMAVAPGYNLIGQLLAETYTST